MMNAFANTGMVINGMTHLSPREAYNAAQRDAVIVDIREEFEAKYKAFDVENVVFLPNSEFQSRYAELPGDIPLIIADGVGLRSKKAVQFLLEHGYSQVANMISGIIEWERAGLPLKVDRGYELHGSCSCQLRSRKGGRPHVESAEKQ